MVCILQYKKKALGCTLYYRKNIDKPQLPSVSGTIFTSQVPILGSSSLKLQKWGGGAIIDRWKIRRGKNPKNRGWQIPQWVSKPKDSGGHTGTGGGGGDIGRHARL